MWLGVFLNNNKKKFKVRLMYIHMAGHEMFQVSMLVVGFVDLKIKVNVVGHGVFGLHCSKFKMKQIKTNSNVAL